MLREIILSVQEQKGPLSLATLSKQLDISIPMLEQMLGTLVRSGKLQEVQPSLPDSCDTCDDCPILNNCDLTNIYKEKQYRITP